MEYTELCFIIVKSLVSLHEEIHFYSKHAYFLSKVSEGVQKAASQKRMIKLNHNGRFETLSKQEMSL